ncbi:MAG: hypothetical protein CSA75_00250 [Sorangium cellulosum]|nr:MAG: hypothetical protein CSA75_00250 [Sorangium cellulosum]
MVGNLVPHQALRVVVHPPMTRCIQMSILKVEKGTYRTAIRMNEAQPRRSLCLLLPDLNSVNNTYKTIRRAAKASTVGSGTQGLRRPVNDLSRGCSIPDVINPFLHHCHSGPEELKSCR